MMPISAGSPIEAVTIRHEKSAITARLSTALRPVTIPTGAGPTKPCQRPISLRGQRISIIQYGRLSLSISVSFDATKQTFQLFSLLSGWRWRANRILLAIRMNGGLIQMEGMS